MAVLDRAERGVAENENRAARVFVWAARSGLELSGECIPLALAEITLRHKRRPERNLRATPGLLRARRSVSVPISIALQATPDIDHARWLTCSWHQERPRMTTFNDREKGFESKFALDQEQEFKAMARRNKLLGLWAAEKMGLSPESAEDYAKAVVRADFEQPGEEDVFRKLDQDFKGSGISVSEGEIRSKMDELASVARDQIRAGE
jgi:hypothetical protein